MPRLRPYGMSLVTHITGSQDHSQVHSQVHLRPLSFEIAILSLHKWSRPKNTQVDLRIHIRQPVLQVYTNPILLTAIEQHEEGILLLGAGVTISPSLRHFSEIQQDRLVLFLQEYHIYQHRSCAVET